MSAPVERKVQASTATAAVSGMVLWVLGKYVFKGDIPDVFASWVYVLVPAALTFAAGYFTHHTHRPDLQQVTVSYTGTPLPPTATTTMGVVGGPLTGGVPVS